MSEHPKLLIVGTGAMACFFGAKLAPYARVTLLGSWRQGLDALQENGIVVEEDGKTTVLPVEVTETPESIGSIALVLVVVKSWQTQRTGLQIAECLSEEGVALTLQNGLGNAQILQEILGVDRAAQGVTTHGATLMGPGHVRIGGYGKISLASHPRLQTLESLFNQAGLSAERVDDLQGLLWTKLVINAGINPLTALLRVRNGELLERVSAQRLMRAAAQEAAEVARAQGIQLSLQDPGEDVAAVAHRTAGNRSSMLQDILRGAPTEIDAINGAIVEHAERIGMEAPVNWTLTELVRAIRDAGDVLNESG
jgi:2-dehydropantoate 2-reductase